MKKKFSLSTWLLFLIPSIVGVVLFMIPLPDGDAMRVPIASLANILAGFLAPVIQWIALITVAIAAIGSSRDDRETVSLRTCFWRQSKDTREDTQAVLVHRLCYESSLRMINFR